MTRRITATMVAVVAGALLVASLGTLILSQLAARRDARRELGRQAQRLAAVAEESQSNAILRAVGAALKLQGAAVLRFGPAGRTLDAPPAGVSLTDLDLPRLRQGRTLTGVNGSLVYAAAPAQRPRALLVVVLTRDVGAARPAVGLWILLAGGVTLAVAVAVALNLGRRLTRPLREAAQATRRIAAGDLGVRVPEEPADGAELAGLARSINAMAAGLERSRGLERQFLLSVSHDLRTPLTSIRGFAEALADGRAPDPAQAASVIITEARRLERLVGDLLELAKLGARRFSLDIRGTDVDEVVGDTAEGFVPAAEQAGVELRVVAPGGSGSGPGGSGSGPGGSGSGSGGSGSRSGPGAPPTARAAADPDRLAQVVANLLENALKFAASSIVVGVGREDGSVTVWVQDDGPGIGPQDRTRIFEPFFQSDRRPSREVGTGLGLAIVGELVAAMGGSVRAEPAGVPGTNTPTGTRMVVALRRWPQPPGTQAGSAPSG